MSRTEQRTIASEVTLEGVGVHSGVHARLTLRPADPDSGLRFRRVDLRVRLRCPQTWTTS